MAAFCDALNAAADAWSGRIWSVLWQSTILIGVVALLAGVALRRSPPAIRYWIWQILALKILLMPFWTLALPLPQYVPQPFVEQTVDSPRPSLSGPTDMPAAEAVDPPIATAAPATRESPETFAPHVTRTTQRRLSWAAWLLVGWGTIVCAQLVRLIRQRFRLAALLRSSTLADAGLADMVGDTARQLGLKTAPQTVLTDTDCSPFACGIRRPVIVLPRGLSRSLNGTELRHVLLHELAHVKRRDLVWGWIGEIARVVYFFHPAVHWICYRIRLERELACDATAISLTGQDAGEYAATLVRVVSQSSEPTVFKTAAASAGMDGGTK